MCYDNHSSIKLGEERASGAGVEGLWPWKVWGAPKLGALGASGAFCPSLVPPSTTVPRVGGEAHAGATEGTEGSG